MYFPDERKHFLSKTFFVEISREEREKKGFNFMS
jgi:hypothetical protein